MLMASLDSAYQNTRSCDSLVNCGAVQIFSGCCDNATLSHHRSTRMMGVLCSRILGISRNVPTKDISAASSGTQPGIAPQAAGPPRESAMRKETPPDLRNGRGLKGTLASRTGTGGRGIARLACALNMGVAEAFATPASSSRRVVSWFIGAAEIAHGHALAHTSGVCLNDANDGALRVAPELAGVERIGPLARRPDKRGAQFILSLRSQYGRKTPAVVKASTKLLRGKCGATGGCRWCQSEIFVAHS